MIKQYVAVPKNRTLKAKDRKSISSKKGMKVYRSGKEKRRAISGGVSEGGLEK